jgi:precorrin-6x reductase
MCLPGCHDARALASQLDEAAKVAMRETVSGYLRDYGSSCSRDMLEELARAQMEIYCLRNGIKT